MQIHNLTRQTTLATQGERAHNVWARFKGLMGRASLAQGEALLLEPESSIHTFFMRFPLDVLYLDRAYRVLRADRAMPPSRIGPVYTRGCRAILELPPGTIEATLTEVGDQVKLVEQGKS